jgi:hypothetical protein
MREERQAGPVPWASLKSVGRFEYPLRTFSFIEYPDLLDAGGPIGPASNARSLERP